MNGLEHYREAERLINKSKHVTNVQTSIYLAAAQVHATLALASRNFALTTATRTEVINNAGSVEGWLDE